MAGILPIALHQNRLYFLFGKENQYADTPGWSDFGGGIDKGETPYQTIIRETQEELTGFLGGDKDIKELLKNGTFNIEHNKYKMHICKMEYNDYLPMYYNNNHRFLEKKLDPELIKKSKIFEKDEIRWVPYEDLKQMRPQFRSYFQEIVDILIDRKKEIIQYAKNQYAKNRKHTKKNRSLKKKTLKKRH